ncbi:MAG: glycoside hydrolase family 13 protein [Caldisphaera sp.]|jgi:glycosidase|uniref:glycoside hydrolase family 13 protein n=1 Tax=Caldisphaera sp. TaxID=2060322 RepID=UPI003D0D2136
MYKYYRPRLGRKRFGEPIVTFSIPWPEKAKRLYLASEFTSYFPGRFELKKEGNRGSVSLKIWEGIYKYFYFDNYYNVLTDFEVEDHEFIKIYPFDTLSSIANIGLQDLRDSIKNGLSDELIIHDETMPSFISKLGNRYHIRIFTIKDQIDDIYLMFFNGKSWNEIKAKKVYSDNYRDYYEAIADNDIKAYKFKLIIDNREKYFGFDGFDDDKPFYVSDGEKEIPWYVGTIYYLIFPDSFLSKDFDYKERLPTKIGGKIDDIINKIDYIKDLGIETIYLTPIYVSPSYHRYDVIDHFNVDPNLGGNEKFKDLIEKAHKKGLKIVIDIVAHHTSPCAKEFKEALRDFNSEKKNWYRFLVEDLKEVNEETMNFFKNYIDNNCQKLPQELKSLKPFYESFFNLWSMPKLNHNNIDVDNHFCEIVKRWLSFGVDGIRVDVAHGIPDKSMEFLKECAHRLKESVTIMEIMGNSSDFPLGKIADSAMNYEIREKIIKFLINEISAYELSEHLNKQYMKLPVNVSNSMYNLLGSHDTPRIINVLGYDVDKVKRAYVIMYSIYGSPSIYYGDEIGLSGQKDPDNRKPMIWNENKWNKEIYLLIKELNKIRLNNSTLKYGSFVSNALNNDGLIIKRRFKKEEIIAYISRKEISGIKIDNHKIIIQEGYNENKLNGYVIALSNLQY